MDTRRDRPADMIVRGAVVYTLDHRRPWANALAVRDGRIVAVGDDADVEALAGAGTTSVDVGGAMVMPGLVDVHTHVGFAGQQAAWELAPSPMAGPEEILAAVAARAQEVGPDEWVVGGVVGSHVLEAAGTAEMLAAIDAAGHGRPVLLREASLHHRWVNSRALEIMGVDGSTPDPKDGRYGRDADGRLVGLLFEHASTVGELAVRRSTADVHARDLRSARTAVSILNACGITATQDAATMGWWLDVFTELDNAGELDAWIVGSMPAREFIESGPVGPELFDSADSRRSVHVRPNFVKAVLDGVPMTRTSKFLEPYKPDPQRTCACAGTFSGESWFTDEDLLDLMEQAVGRGLHVKLHATADGTVRQVLDAVETMRVRHGDAPVFHIAHTEFVHPDDVARFAELGVVADASPVLWFPSPMTEIIGQQVPDHVMDRMWPLRELTESGALLAAGSDWPAAMPMPNPWLSIETMVTRRSPDPSFPGALNPDQALDLATAVEAHTANPARAMGLGEEVGRLAVGLSADFIVLDRNLFEIPVQDIHDTRVLQTWFAGRLVHDSTT
ncbi:amidohydrolase [Pseudonocardia xinjiangensis]|uniref:amidohydrolase n=1 Tax=Pseudonocardia xinjiangensis TaxID=75289 RepID=UPI003D90AD10